jgi:hypothetical protein
MRSQLATFFDLINGRSPFEIESYRQRGEAMARQGLVPATAFSAIEQALWEALRWFTGTDAHRGDGRGRGSDGGAA